MINGSGSGGVEELVDRKEENRRRGDGGNRRAFYTSTSMHAGRINAGPTCFSSPAPTGREGGCGGRAVPLWTQESDAMTSINATRIPTATPTSTLDSQCMRFLMVSTVASCLRLGPMLLHVLLLLISALVYYYYCPLI
ncbi:hypothetical protein BJX66DRAFT_222653 [Aspergillus keveii]|uniref:Uncharacterized protein n=1 Tax=Aspergillus keveii TaxID=714993 RepID=A0ABR4G3E9_9EURO